MKNDNTIEKNIEISNILLDGIINLNRLMLKNKPHIKKYNKLRKLHDEILDNMENYTEVKEYKTPVWIYGHDKMI